LYDSLYYTIITVAGVGYGDITPITQEGKFVAIALASLGMPLYLITASLIATKLIEGMKKMRKTTTKAIISKVKALIIEEGKILFLKTERNNFTIWDLPGGTIHYGERVENALIRRVMQEINTNISVEKSLGIWRWVDQKTGIFSLCHTYLAHLSLRDKMLLKRSRYLPDKKTEVVSWVLVKDIVS
jgi:ADP-ribose pyrophosphatase YjhB (NUDIX family)